MRSWLLALVLLLVALQGGHLHGQEPTPFAWKPEARATARLLSDGLLVTQSGFYAYHLWKAPDRKRAIGCAAARVGVTVGTTELVKRLTHRERPDGSDNLSFWSGHAANTMAMSGWRYEVGVPISLGTGYLRTASKRHYISDALAGLGAGALANLICRGDDGYGKR